MTWLTHPHSARVRDILARYARPWQQVLPAALAQEQAIWEFNQSIRRAVDAGASYTEIARKLGVSRTAVKWRYDAASRTYRDRWTPGKWTANPVKQRPPVAAYLAQKGFGQ